jgi:parvulin-like peptidyl-prolyl isomerase
VVSGKLSFAEAAEKHSAGPSRHRGGDLGFIARYGPMVEAFSRAAFALQLDEVSRPVITSFGVHLIKCTDVQPGKQTWSDVRNRLEPAAIAEMLTTLSAELAKDAQIEYTGAMPYFNPATKKLVLPVGGSGN